MAFDMTDNGEGGGGGGCCPLCLGWGIINSVVPMLGIRTMGHGVWYERRWCPCGGPINPDSVLRCACLGTGAQEGVWQNMCNGRVMHTIAVIKPCYKCQKEKRNAYY